MKFSTEAWLVISDLQIPFEAHKSLEFYRYLKRHFKIDDDHVLCVGDEVDQLNGGMYPKDPDGQYTANHEIKVSRDKIQEWAAIFPRMRVTISNHGMRWARKAAAAEIPSQMLRAYQDVLHIPEGWKYRDRWVIDAKHPFMMTHGMEFGGKTPYRQAAELLTISCVFGHLHSSAGICHVCTMDKNIWAMNVGSCIDVESYAFKYGKWNKFKPNNGGGVILSGGATPIWLPYDL